MRYLLDTNVISELMKHPSGNAAWRIRTLPPNVIFTSIIVAGELQYGGRKKNSAPLRQRIHEILDEITILPLDSACADLYGTIRADLEKKGTPIGANDLWIAAHALASEMTLVTGNVQEFARVERLKTENWLE